MADEIIPATVPAVASTPAAVASPSPVADSPAATPSIVTTPTTPAEASPPVTQAADAAPVAKPAETVLGAEPVKTIENKSPEAQKPAEVKADSPVEIKKEEGKQSDEPAPLPTYEAFKLPEGFTLENEKLGEFTKELGEFQTRTKAEQVAVQEFGQKLVDRHIAEVQTTVKRLNEHYTQAWEKQKIEWKDAFVKDPEIGGNRQETTVKSAVEAIDRGSSYLSLDVKMDQAKASSHASEFRQVMETTGIGNHPAVIRVLNGLNKEIADLRAKYETEGGVKPLPGTKPVAQSTSKVAKRYGDPA